MTCSADRKLARGFALALLAIALIGAKPMGANFLGNLLGANKAMAGELADRSSEITTIGSAATPAATPTRGLVSTPVELKAEPVLPAAEEPRKVERSALRSHRVKRDEDRGGRAAMGLILGVGF